MAGSLAIGYLQMMKLIVQHVQYIGIEGVLVTRKEIIRVNGMGMEEIDGHVIVMTVSNFVNKYFFHFYRKAGVSKLFASERQMSVRKACLRSNSSSQDPFG